MPASPDMPKLRWWQFSLRKFVLLVTLFSVLAVAGYRFREWGGDLTEERYNRFVRTGMKLSHDEQEFNRENWLPLTFYRLTWGPDWDCELGSGVTIDYQIDESVHSVRATNNHTLPVPENWKQPNEDVR